MKVRRWMAAAGCSMMLAAGPAQAQEYAGDAGWGALAAVANLGYIPAKLVYAGIGGLTGGLAFVCTGGNLDPAEAVWSNALGGTYVLSPRMLRGEESIAFAGAARATEVAASAGDTAAPASAPLQESTLGAD